MAPEEAYELLETISLISGSQDKLKKVKVSTTPVTKTKKPPVNFAKCGILVGAELVFIEDDSIKVIVVGDRKVQYGNEFTSLSAVTGKLKGYKSIAGPSYFTYNGRLICDIAEDTQWKGC